MRIEVSPILVALVFFLLGFSIAILLPSQQEEKNEEEEFQVNKLALLNQIDSYNRILKLSNSSETYVLDSYYYDDFIDLIFVNLTEVSSKKRVTLIFTKDYRILPQASPPVYIEELFVNLLPSQAKNATLELNSSEIIVERVERISSPLELDFEEEPTMGNPNAPVVIVEFGDFQCPFCRKFFVEVLPKIKKEYVETGKVFLVYKDFPINSHPMAQLSGEAVQCAKEQGKEWELHDKIYEEQDKIARESNSPLKTIYYSLDDLRRWAKEIGLNMEEFNNCLASRKYMEEVLGDKREGQLLNVIGTPTFFINEKQILGVVSYPAFKNEIEKELERLGVE